MKQFNKILEKKCNDYLIHIEQLTSSYEDLKKKLYQNQGGQRVSAKYEEKIELLNQNLMENSKRIEELFDENEALKRRLNQEANSRSLLEEDKKQISNYLEQLKMEAQFLQFY